MEKNLFQKLPKVDILMKSEKLEEISKNLSYHNYYQAVKDGIEFFRNKIKNREINDFTEDEVILKIKEFSGIKNKPNLRRVINGTGTIIHTNLGRSIFNKKIAEKGSILMSVRAPVGDLNIAPEKISIGRGLCSLNAKNENNHFLFYLLKYFII